MIWQDMVLVLPEMVSTISKRRSDKRASFENMSWNSELPGDNPLGLTLVFMAHPYVDEVLKC